MKRLGILCLCIMGCRGNVQQQDIPQPLPLSSVAYTTSTIAPSQNNDSLLLLSLLGIIGNFGKIFIDPHNIPQVQQSVINIIDDIVTAAHLIVTSRAPGQAIAYPLPLLLVRALYYKAYALEHSTKKPTAHGAVPGVLRYIESMTRHSGCTETTTAHGECFA